MTATGMLRRKRALPARRMAVEGKEAVGLYAAEIAEKIDALNKQLALLQSEFAERRRLLGEIADLGRQAAGLIADASADGD